MEIDQAKKQPQELVESVTDQTSGQTTNQSPDTDLFDDVWDLTDNRDNQQNIDDVVMEAFMGSDKPSNKNPSDVRTNPNLVEAKGHKDAIHHDEWDSILNVYEETAQDKRRKQEAKERAEAKAKADAAKKQELEKAAQMKKVENAKKKAEKEKAKKAQYQNQYDDEYEEYFDDYDDYGDSYYNSMGY